MKALYTPSPGVYGLVDRPKPTPGPTDALVQVKVATVCHTDVTIREGKAGHVTYPFIPGHEFSGVVAEVGSAVKRLTPGDRVAVHTILNCGECAACRKGDVQGCENYDELGSKRDGGFAEYCMVPARHLFKLPESTSLEEAAMAEPLANAVSAVSTAEVKYGDRVVIIGPGPIGLLALQVAILANPSALVMVGTSDERLAFATQLGATHVVNVKKCDAAAEINRIFGGKGADVVIECAGNKSAFDLGYAITGWRGRLIIEGSMGEEDTVTLVPRNVLTRSMTIRGVAGWNTANFALALDLIAAGQVQVKPLITHTLPIDEWETAFDMITTRKREAMKVQLTFGK